MADGGLPGGIPSPPDRIVLHIDNDCFYAACERLREPSLRGEPLVIGMGYQEDPPSGAVATASYEAREYGVQSAQPIAEAIERLPPRGGDESREEYDDSPTAWYRPVDIEFYSEIAREVKTILAEYAETIREVSIDEAYLDCGDQTDWEHAETFGRTIKRRVQNDVGIPTSIGIGPNMSVAKIASDHDKPDGLVVVPPAEVESFLAPLPIDRLHGVGPVTATALNDAGLETVGDLAEADPRWLVDRFGKRGRELHQRAQGFDPRPVTPRGNPKSLSRESSFSAASGGSEAVQTRLTELAEAVAERATDRGATYQTIGIKVVTTPYDVHTRERSLPGPVDDPALVRSVTGDLLTEFAEETVRKVGVRVSNLSFASGDQRALDTWSNASTSTDPEPSVLNRRGQTTLRAFGTSPTEHEES